MDQSSIDFVAEVVDTSNFTSSGYQSNLDGMYSANATCSGPYNGSLALTQGQLITMTFATGGGGPSFAIPFRVSNIKLATAARNQVAKADLTLASSGTFTVTF